MKPTVTFLQKSRIERSHGDRGQGAPLLGADVYCGTEGRERWRRVERRRPPVLMQGSGAVDVCT
jgi:hypothetical protein